MAMTWKELVKKINDLALKEQDLFAIIYNSRLKEYYTIQSINESTSEHPFISIKECNHVHSSN